MNNIYHLLAVFFFTILLAAEEPLRTWTSTDGRTIEARFLEMMGNEVRIKYPDRRVLNVPLNKFSPADQEYVRKAHGRVLFNEPKPFEGEEKGSVIIASARGEVEVLASFNSRYADLNPLPRPVIAGETVGPGFTIFTGEGAEADLLLTNGTLAHLEENSKLKLSALYQKAFKGNKVRASELTEEVSPSRTFLELDEGSLVVEVRKLSKESSFVIKTPIAQTGIRGTQFKLLANSNVAELSVLEGRVDFLDGQQLAQPVEIGKKAGSKPGEKAKLGVLSASEKTVIAKAIAQTKAVSASIDLNRLADSANGYSQEPIYKVKSALNMEMIWCPPGAFRTTGSFARKPHPIILTKGFYMGKYEVTQEEYEKVMRSNPSELKGDRLPVLNTSFEQSLEFCAKLNKKERIPRGWEFTLPTLAEREYACRAGTTTNYHWGNDFDPKLANGKGSGFKQPIEVGSFPPNAWGFHDMHGNVMERVYENSGCEYEEGVLQIDPTQHKGMFPYMADAGGNWTINIGSGGHMNGGGTQSIHEGFRVIFRQVD